MENKQQAQKSPTRLAIIGLIGTILTVCGGLTGAIIGGITTIYKTEAETKRLSISAPQTNQALTVDTRQVVINSSKVAQLDSSKVQVFEDLGFVMDQPGSGWEDGGQITYSDLFLEHNTNLSPLIFFYKLVKDAWNDQPVRQIRYKDPVTVTFVNGSTENGAQEDPTQLESPSVTFYSRFIILALDKAVVQKDFSLYSLALDWGKLHQGGVNDLVSNPDSQYVFEQVSWKLKHVKVDGRLVDLTLQRWALFAEGPKRYYIVEVQYVPAAGQSMQVLDDLQGYLNAFRVIQ